MFAVVVDYWGRLHVETPETLGALGEDPPVGHVLRRLRCVLESDYRAKIALAGRNVTGNAEPGDASYLGNRTTRDQFRTDDGTGREVEDVHDGIDTFVKGRARVRLGEMFGDIERAKEVLAGLTELLSDLDDIPAATDDPTSSDTGKRKGGKT